MNVAVLTIIVLAILIHVFVTRRVASHSVICKVA